jgi:hypothetical protein
MFLRRVFTTGEEPRQTVTVFRSKIAERIQAGEKSRNAPSFSAAEVPAEKEGISLSLRGKGVLLQHLFLKGEEGKQLMTFVCNEEV